MSRSHRHPARPGTPPRGSRRPRPTSPRERPRKPTEDRRRRRRRRPHRAPVRRSPRRRCASPARTARRDREAGHAEHRRHGPTGHRARPALHSEAGGVPIGTAADGLGDGPRGRVPEKTVDRPSDETEQQTRPRRPRGPIPDIGRGRSDGARVSDADGETVSSASRTSRRRPPSRGPVRPSPARRRVAGRDHTPRHARPRPLKKGRIRVTAWRPGRRTPVPTALPHPPPRPPVRPRRAGPAAPKPAGSDHGRKPPRTGEPETMPCRVATATRIPLRSPRQGARLRRLRAREWISCPIS
ncbi:hypothetical protein FHR81_002005 [Actinoalloteichus hoggarensis]|uniref:Uncharacterized protein n=1 Tax=Actinoalloteichus hoggarensis TaxID=1470176 RepID=A0A221W5S0_9PSEU|nr:hypothetical protein AHOG_17050 [Actinoalloteichus hoggarensis]MBB5920967.1 hypothetical protein [Actinoalloteichus hoggarensis]